MMAILEAAPELIDRTTPIEEHIGLARLARPMGALKNLYFPALLLFTLLAFATLLSEGLWIYWIN